MTAVMEKAQRESVREAAQKLADYNAEVSPDLAGIYWFPADGVVRLVMLDPITLPSEEMVPYYFGAFPQEDVSFPSAVALIRPEEKSLLSPPPGWGDWDTAVQLWPKK